jgi:hypothetical protein
MRGVEHGAICAWRWSETLLLMAAHLSSAALKLLSAVNPARVYGSVCHHYSSRQVVRYHGARGLETLAGVLCLVYLWSPRSHLIRVISIERRKAYVAIFWLLGTHNNPPVLLSTQSLSHFGSLVSCSASRTRNVRGLRTVRTLAARLAHVDIRKQRDPSELDVWRWLRRHRGRRHHVKATLDATISAVGRLDVRASASPHSGSKQNSLSIRTAEDSDNARLQSYSNPRLTSNFAECRDHKAVRSGRQPSNLSDYTNSKYTSVLVLPTYTNDPDAILRRQDSSARW